MYKGREYFIGNINEMINEFHVIYDDLFFDRDNSRNICHTLYENVDDNMINTNKYIYTENNVEPYKDNIAILNKSIVVGFISMFIPFQPLLKSRHVLLYING